MGTDINVLVIAGFIVVIFIILMYLGISASG